MSLHTKIKDLAIRIGQEIKSVRTSISTKLSTSGLTPNRYLKTDNTGNVVLVEESLAPKTPNDNVEYVMKNGVWVSHTSISSLPWSSITSKPTEFTPTVHNHDDRYFTEAEVTALLANKSNTIHNHDDRYFTEAEVTALLALKEAVFTKNTAFNKNFGSSSGTVSEGNHNHNTVYYTKSEVDNLLAAIDAGNHNHNTLYYLKSEIDLFLGPSLSTTHNHDDRYFTEAEVTALLASKSNTTHNHDDRYFTEAEVTALLANKSNTIHNHDDRYFTEAEVTALLANKSNTIHNHDDRYFTESEVTTLLTNLETELRAEITGVTPTGSVTPVGGIEVILPSGGTFGKFVDGDTIPEGLSLLEVIQEAVSEYVAAQFDLPTFSISIVVSNFPGQDYYEVGELLDIKVYYTYDQNDAGNLVNVVTEFDNIPLNTANDLSMYAWTTSNLTTNSYVIEATVNYSAGSGTKPNSLGVQESNTITAGSIISNSIIIKVVRPIFHGSVTSTQTTSNGVRTNMTKTLTDEFPLELTLNSGTVNKVFQIWIPSTRSLTSVIDEDALGANITNSYVGTPLNILAADSTIIPGTIYTMSMAVPYSINHSHKITIN